jgi:hypothetical protein
MKTLIIKSLLTSLCQRGDWFDRLTMTLVILSLPKDGKEGRFYDNDVLLMHSLVYNCPLYTDLRFL